MEDHLSQLLPSKEMKSMTQVQTLEEAVWVSLYAHVIGKGMNQSVFPTLAISK